jgi:hypothetical protein
LVDVTEFVSAARAGNDSANVVRRNREALRISSNTFVLLLVLVLVISFWVNSEDEDDNEDETRKCGSSGPTGVKIRGQELRRKSRD